jgi:single-strand DNA-binding protein
MINKVILVGRVGTMNPDAYKEFESGKAVIKFSIATNAKWYNKATSAYVDETTWHNIEAWGHQAKFCRDYVNVGDLIYIEGSIKIGEYEKDGDKRKTFAVLGMRVQKLTNAEASKKASASNNNNNAPF